MSEPPKLTRVHKVLTGGLYRLDSIPITETYFTEEGYFVDNPIVTSVGIFEYKNPDGSIRRELRLPEHVFAEESMQSYKGKPVIITHDVGYVDSNNVEDEIIGTILSDGYKDGDNVRAEIIIHNTEAMKKSKLRELSLGYDLTLDETPGEWNGQPYDAVQTNIVINHLALVKEARAGEQARLNIDGKNQNIYTEHTELRSVDSVNELKGETENMSKINKDEHDISSEVSADNISETEPAGQTAEEKLQFIKDRKDRRDSESITKTQSDEDVDTLLEIIEQLEAEKDLNQAKMITDCQQDNFADPAGGVTIESGSRELSEPNSIITIRTDAIDKMVSDRISLGRLGDKINIDVWNMKPQEAKKAIIKNRFPTIRLDGKSDGYIDAMFVDVSKDIQARKDTDYQRKQMSQNRKDGKDFIHSKSGAEMAREKMAKQILNGGKE